MNAIQVTPSLIALDGAGIIAAHDARRAKSRNLRMFEMWFEHFRDAQRTLCVAEVNPKYRPYGHSLETLREDAAACQAATIGFASK